VLVTVQRILDLKGKGAVHIAPEAMIPEFIQSLELQNADALVVSNDGIRVEGIISERDVVRGLKEFGSDILRKAVRELMTVKVITCAPGDSLENVAAIMISKHVRHLPVVASGEFVGMVSIRDVLRLHLGNVQSDADAMRGYIQDH